MNSALRKKKRVCQRVEPVVVSCDPGPTLNQMVLDQQRLGESELSPELTQATLPLLHRLSAQFSSRLPPGIEQADLFQEAVFALFKCIERFKPDKGASFITFASIRIRGAMNDYLREIDWAPRNVRSRSKQVDKVRNRFYLAHGRQPSEDELVYELNVEPAECERVLRDGKVTSVGSLGYRRSEDDPPLHDALPDPFQGTALDSVIRHDLREFIVKDLSRAERLIVILYYYEGMNMREIGQTLDLSESRICQMHTSILAQLRAHLHGREDVFPSQMSRNTESHQANNTIA